MATIRKKILDAAYAAVNDSGKPAGSKVEENRNTPFESSELPAMNLLFYEEKPDRNPTTNTWTERKLTIKVECCATDLASLDDLMEWVVKAMLKDERFGGLSTKVIELSSEFNTVPADKDYLAATVDFQISYRTLAADPGNKG